VTWSGTGSACGRSEYQQERPGSQDIAGLHSDQNEGKPLRAPKFRRCCCARSLPTGFALTIRQKYSPITAARAVRRHVYPVTGHTALDLSGDDKLDQVVCSGGTSPGHNPVELQPNAALMFWCMNS
jgi:hypothetical protein